MWKLKLTQLVDPSSRRNRSLVHVFYQTMITLRVYGWKIRTKRSEYYWKNDNKHVSCGLTLNKTEILDTQVKRINFDNAL